MRTGADDDVGFHSIVIQPFHLREDRCDANAAADEHVFLGLTLLIRHVDELRRTSERAYNIEEGVADIVFRHLLSRFSDSLEDNCHGAVPRVVVADCERDTLSFFCHFNNQELPRKSRSRETRCLDFHHKGVLC